VGSVIPIPGLTVSPVYQLKGPLVVQVRERRLLEGLVESVEGGGAAALVAREAEADKTPQLAQVAEVASKRVGMGHDTFQEARIVNPTSRHHQYLAAPGPDGGGEIGQPGSGGLRADIGRHDGLLMSLPRLSVTDLGKLPWAG
jgi:hypothetical protein